MRLRTPVAAVIVYLATLVPRPSLAQDPSQGQARIGGQMVTFAAPLGILDPARKHVSIVFVTQPMSSAKEEAASKAGRWDVQSAGPAVVLDLDFGPTSTSGLTTDISGCRVGFYGFRTPLELKGKAADCHILSSGGMLRSGGTLLGLVQGQGKTYSVRLPFSVTFGQSVTVPRTSVAEAAPAAAAPPAAAASIPANTVSASGTFKGQRIAASHGLAWWDSEHKQLRLALFDHAPPAGMLADLRNGSWGEGGPIMTVYLAIEGQVRPASVTYCYVGLDFPKGGSLSQNTNAKGCGLTELGGDAKAGGTISARLKGQAPGPGEAPWTWDLRFNLPIAK